MPRANYLGLRLAIAVLPMILLAGTAACSPRQITPPDAQTLVPVPGTSATQCPQEEVPPKIMEVRPAQITPGSDVTVIGSGGFIQDTCGSTIEGSRVFKVYLDNQPVADFSCTINHCEGKFTLSSSVALGAHCLSAQKGTCQMELQVAAK